MCKFVPRKRYSDRFWKQMLTCRQSSQWSIWAGNAERVSGRQQWEGWMIRKTVESVSDTGAWSLEASTDRS